MMIMIVITNIMDVFESEEVEMSRIKYENVVKCDRFMGFIQIIY